MRLLHTIVRLKTVVSSRTQRENSGQREEDPKEREKQKKSSNSTTSTITTPTDSYDGVDAALDTLDATGVPAFAIIGAQNGVRACPRFVAWQLLPLAD
eukprot:scaffold55289_cov53-Attheya_sp.AAC.4